MFKSLYGFGGRCREIRDICMDFEPCLKVHSLISVQHKSIKLDQMIHLNLIFDVVVSNRPYSYSHNCTGNEHERESDAGKSFQMQVISPA